MITVICPGCGESRELAYTTSLRPLCRGCALRYRGVRTHQIDRGRLIHRTQTLVQNLRLLNTHHSSTALERELTELEGLMQQLANDTMVEWLIARLPEPQR